MEEFFEPPPSVDPEPRRLTPGWFGPPSGTLPGVVAVERVLARTEHVAVCVTRVAAYPSGFELDLVTMSADESDEIDPMLFNGLSFEGNGIPAEMLRFGVQFADGAKATNTGGLPLDDPDTSPEGPVMFPGGGGGGGGNWRQSMWIWPLPPPGALSLVCEWPAAGIGLTRREIGAQPILDAAARARVIFVDGPAVEP